MEVQKQKSWWGRNWPWVLPVGGCLTVILLFVFGIGAIFFGVTKALKNSTPYEYAVDLAMNHPDVIGYLGEPVETDGMLSGNISLDSNGGDVDFQIPLKGRNGKGSLVVKGEKIDGEWIYEKLYVLIKENNEQINLLDKTLEGI